MIYRNTVHRTQRPITGTTIFLLGVNVGAWGFVLLKLCLRA